MAAAPEAVAAAAALQGPSIPLVAMPVPPNPNIPRVHPKTGAPILQDPYGVLYSAPPTVKADGTSVASVGGTPHVVVPPPGKGLKPPEGRNGERDAVSALLCLSSSGISKARKLKRDKVSQKWHDSQKWHHSRCALSQELYFIPGWECFPR